MDENLYDEFGNYIGPDIPEVDIENISEEEHENDSKSIENENEDTNNKNKRGENQNPLARKIVNEKYSIVLNEDKNYYPEAEEIFPGVETLVMEEDAQPLTEPIVAPIFKRDFDVLEKKIPDTNFDYDFMAGLMTRPELIRNVNK
jgi:U5 small nuclear ribonucleoprotein component